MSRAKIYNFLTGALGTKVYQDLIPETADLPAASYYITGDPTEGSINGGVDLRRYTVTVDVATETNRLDTDALVNKIKALDQSTNHQDFQLVTVINSLDTPRNDSSIEFYQTSLDLEFTMRSSAL